MVQSSVADGHLHALLVGVDLYLSGRSASRVTYPSLRGAVRDVRRMESFLLRRLGVPAERIRRLTASGGEGGEPPEPPGDRPTYDNLVAALRRLDAGASPGDQILVHFSSHGGRTPTILQAVKGSAAFDECLVPWDYGETGRYLRDFELAFFVWGMVERGLRVTLVLDSCHSGGAIYRGGDVATRGIGVLDTVTPPAASAVASPQELAAAWAALAGPVKRSVHLGSGWLPEPRGYVLLAACRPQEDAYEYSPRGAAGVSGALTHWLLDSLGQGGREVSYRQLHQRLLARVHNHFPRQTPMLEGEGNRRVFGREELPSRSGVTVQEVAEEGRRVRLAAGQLQGVARGARFAISSAERDPEARGRWIAEVSEAGATASWAEAFREGTAGPPPEPGDTAVLVDPGPRALTRRVRLVGRGRGEEAALERLGSTLRKVGEGWLEPVGGEEPADLEVGLDGAFAWEICDGAGELLEHLGPPLAADGPRSAERVAARLVHLARYRAVQAIANFDPTSPLHGRLRLTFGRFSEGWRPGDRVEILPFEGPVPEIAAGGWFGLTIENRSAQVLNLAVLDLQPDWGISQLFPSPTGGAFHPLDPGASLPLPLQASLPPGYRRGTDVLKIFAALGPTDFRWLELPPLGRTAAGPTRGGAPANPLERLFAGLTAPDSPLRGVRLAPGLSWEWAVEQVELVVVA